MAVYNNIKCAFVHIPKTGGQSITKMLEEAELGCKHEGSFELDHLTMSAILERVNLNSYFKFAIVRNPLDRLVSEYHFSKRYRPYLPNTDHYRFSRYVRAISKLDINGLPHNMVNHLYKQKDFLYKDNNLLVDYVGRFETLKESIDYVSKKLNIKLTLPHVNKSCRKCVDFDSKTLELVRNLYKEDYEIFGY